MQRVGAVRIFGVLEQDMPRLWPSERLLPPHVFLAKPFCLYPQGSENAGGSPEPN